MDHPFFDLAAVRAASLAESFNPHICGNLIWSFACSRKDIPDILLSSILLNMSTTFEQFKQSTPQNLTKIVWGLTSLGLHNIGGDLMSRLNLEIFERFGSAYVSKQFTTESLSNYFWAFGVHHEGAFDSRFQGSQQKQAIIEHCKRFEDIFLERIHQFSSQEIASVCTACARLEYFSEQMMEKIADLVVRSIRAFEGQNLATILFSFGKLRYASKRFFTCMSLVVESKLGTFSFQDISNTLWAYAVLNLEAGPFVSKFVEEIIHRIHAGDEGVNPSQILNIVWSLSLLNAINESSWNILINAIDFDALRGNKEVCRQIFESNLIVNARNGSKVSIEIPENARAACEEAWSTVNTEKVHISDFHMQVSKTLELMGEHHIVAYLDEDGNSIIDIALPSEKIALQVEMPKHFTRSNDPLGGIIARADLLQARGWHVISIPFFAWTEDPKAQKRFLEHALGNVREKKC